MAIETSLLTFSPGRLVTNKYGGLRDFPGGSVSETLDLAMAKQTFFPPGDAV